jgi:hypothetical protein
MKMVWHDDETLNIKTFVGLTEFKTIQYDRRNMVIDNQRNPINYSRSNEVGSEIRIYFVSGTQGAVS